jgi:hypothetical protein
MREDISVQIQKKALFVGGLNSWFRDKDDENAKSAVRDATRFVDSLPQQIDEPAVSSGTTASPETIVTLFWLIGGHQTIKSVSIDFRGNGQCDVHWNEHTGRQNRLQNISVQQLIELDLPTKIDALKVAARFGGPRPT